MESGFEVDDMKAYKSFDHPSVHHHALSKNKVGMNFYDRFQRFSIDDSNGTLACTGLDPPTHLPSPSPTRKRVTFDSKVKTYEHSAVEESVELFEEKKKEEEVKPLKSRQAPCSSEGSHVTSNSPGSYPPNHRYQNCRESDDDDEHVTDCDDSDDDGCLLDDYYEDKWDNQVYTEEIADNVVLDVEKSTASTARDRSRYVNALLNPIENLTQWKAVKSKGRTKETQSPKEQNANLISNQEHKLNASFSPLVSELSSFSIKQKSRDETKKLTTREVAVDANLSTSQTQTTQNFSRKPIRSGERCSLLQRFHP